jgi:CO/xanthine dehydrogenase FAD-binding subunit
MKQVILIMCVALAVLNAQVRVTGRQGERIIPIGDYHRLPGDEPWRDNALQPGELVSRRVLSLESCKCLRSSSMFL